MITLEACEQLVTKRTESILKVDMADYKSLLSSQIKGARILVVGAAGSIGSSVVKTILRFRPGALTLVDLSENNLVELVRDLRSTEGLSLPLAFRAMPIGLGSNEFERYLSETKPYDFFLNLCALKHVRSEKDIYSIMRMLDTNVLFLNEVLRHSPYTFSKVFSVSSDKAANAANLMGASKMIMEKVLLAQSERQPFSTARFANVAFSNGSLPYGFLRRIERRQPISAPRDVMRYFISHREAGELCVLSCFLGENRDVFFPKLIGGQDERTFSSIAIDLLESLGYEAYECKSEEEARRRTEELIHAKKWPCFFSDTDTTGEKGFEEFYEEGEDINLERFESIGVVRRSAATDIDRESIYRFIDFCLQAKHKHGVTKETYVGAMRELIPTLRHVETGKNLDQKM